MGFGGNLCQLLRLFCFNNACWRYTRTRVDNGSCIVNGMMQLTFLQSLREGDWCDSQSWQNKWANLHSPHAYSFSAIGFLSLVGHGLGHGNQGSGIPMRRKSSAATRLEKTVLRSCFPVTPVVGPVTAPFNPCLGKCQIFPMRRFYCMHLHIVFMSR